MSSKTRLLVFLVGALGIACLLGWAFAGIPAFGHYPGPYGDLVNATVIPLRHVTDAVSAVNFDYRGFDTLGEEFILFASVLGALVLLRQHDEKKGAAGNEKDQLPARQVPEPSDAVRVWTLGLTGPTVLYGLYVVSHGQLTPGGGFQGGVILATAPLLVYLSESFDTFKKVASHRWVEIGEGVGAGLFAAIGLLPLLRGEEFLKNFLSYGNQGVLTSGGTMPLISLTTGLEVAAGFVLLLYAFLQETLA